MRTLFCAALILVLSGCAAPDYMQRGQKTPESLQSFEGKIGVRQLWSVKLGDGNRYADHGLVPALADGRIYVADWDGDVYAVEAKTGRRVWDADLDEELAGGPTVGDGVVAIGTRAGEVVGLSAKDGSVLWRSGVTSEVLTPPAYGDGLFVVRSADGRVFGLRSSDGSRSWLYDRTVPVLTLRGNSPPVIAGGRALVGLDNGKLVALDLKTGEQAWEATIGIPRGRTDLERMVDVDGRISEARGTAYVSAYQGRTMAVDVESGNSVWTRDVPSYDGTAEDVGNVYVTDDDQRVWALDRFNGASVWRQDRLSKLRLTAPVVFGKYVVVGSNDGYLNWLSRDNGKLEARTRLEPLSPSERDAAIRPNAMERYVFVPPDWIAQPPTVTNGRLYVWTLKGQLAAYRLKGQSRQ